MIYILSSDAGDIVVLARVPPLDNESNVVQTNRNT